MCDGKSKYSGQVKCLAGHQDTSAQISTILPDSGRLTGMMKVKKSCLVFASPRVQYHYGDIPSVHKKMARIVSKIILALALHYGHSHVRHFYDRDINRAIIIRSIRITFGFCSDFESLLCNIACE